MANDDEVWITKGWDRRLNEEADKFPDDIYCIYFDDGYIHDKGCSFPMISRKWFETLGYFTPGIFKFLANDTWIEYTARYIDRLHYVPDVLVEHRHHLYGNAEIDNTYKRNIDEYLGKMEDATYFHSKECQDKIKEEAKKLISEMDLIVSFMKLKDRVDELEKNKMSLIDNKINNIIDALAWWIPIRKKRDEFRNRLLGNFIRGGNYKSYWINDNCNNIIPKNWGEFPEGFNVIDFLREITEELDFKSVLDFGCGYGRLSKAFDSDKYLGIDLNYKALKIARDDNAGYKYEETFIDTEYYPNSDLTNVYTVFLHLDDNTLEEVLLKLSKSTNKYIIISEIMGREWRRNGLPPAFCRDKEEYIKYLNKYGFELYKEYDKPYKRYIEDKNWDDKKNRNVSFLIFRKY